MKFLKKITKDSKTIIQDLKDINDSLISAVTEYQEIIFDQKEVIIMLEEEIRRLKNELAEPHRFEEEII